MTTAKVNACLPAHYVRSHARYLDGINEKVAEDLLCSLRPE
jgi:hypothetical protein